MSFMDKLGRGALAVGTLGLSETTAGKRIGQAFGLSKPDVAKANVDTSELEAQRQQGNDAYREWLAQAGNFNYNAPGITPAKDTFAGDVTARDPGPVERYSASTVTAPGHVQVTLPQQANGVTAQNVQAPSASASVAPGARIDTGQSDQIRAQQTANLSALNAAAAGKGPSAADAFFAGKLGDVTQTQMGAVGQARGTDQAAQRREAILGIGRQGTEAALQGAQLKAQEQQAARGQLTGALSDVRGTDVGTAVQQAGFNQQANMENAGRETDVSKYNSGLAAEVNQNNADRALNAGQFTAGAQNQRDLNGAQLRLDADAGNAQRDLAAGTTNAMLGTGAAAANAGARNARDEYFSTLKAGIDTGNVNRQQGVNDTNAGYEQGSKIANQGADIQGQQLTQQTRAGLRGSALDAANQALGATEFATGVNRDVALGNAGATNTANAQSLNNLQKTVTGVVQGVSSSGASRIANAQSLAPPPPPGYPTMAGEPGNPMGGGSFLAQGGDAGSYASYLAQAAGAPPGYAQPDDAYSQYKRSLFGAVA